MKKFYLHSNLSTGNSSYRLKRIIILTLIFCMMLNYVAPIKVSKADATTFVNVRIDYLEELAYVTTGTGGSTRFYMSTDGCKTWEALVLDPSASVPVAVVDISTLLSTKEVIINFKGNKDMNPYPQKLLPEDKSLLVTYKPLGDSGRVDFGNTTYPIEYRKGSNGAWKLVTNLYLPTASLETKGATLYFRTTADVGRRAGKIVSLKIPKKPTAPSVRLDAGKLIITGMRLNQTQYRLGEATEWTTFTSTDPRATSKDLYSFLSVTPSAIAPIPAGVIEFRTLGTDKKLNSAVKIIEITQQPIIPGQITLTGTTLNIVDSNTKNRYEYSIVLKSATLNLNTARWTSVSTGKPVIIKKLNVDDKVYVRIKSATDPSSKKPVLASICQEYKVTGISLQ